MTATAIRGLRFSAVAWVGLLLGGSTAAQAPATQGSVKEQKALLKRAERLQSMMQSLKQRYELEGRKYYVALLEEGLGHLEESGLLRQLNAAGVALEKALTHKALEAQQKAVSNLERLLAILMDRRSVEDLERDAQRVREQLEDLNRLRDQERKIRERVQNLREESRTPQERKIGQALRSLASKERKQANLNAGLSTPLQDELERALAEVRDLRRMETQLRAKLERDNAAEAQAANRLVQRLNDLIRGLEGQLSQLQRQEALDSLSRNLDRLAGHAARGDATRQDLRDAAAQARRAARDSDAKRDEAGKGASAGKPDELAKRLEAAADKLDQLADQAGKADQRKPAAAAVQEAEKVLSGTLEDLRSRSIGRAEQVSAQSRQTAAESRKLAQEFARRGKADGGQPAATPDDKEARRKSKLDAATAKDLEKAADELAASSKELGTNQSGKEPSLARAQMRSQAAMRHLLQAMARQMARNQSPESLAREIAERASQAAQSLESVAGNDEQTRKSSEKLAEAGQAMGEAGRKLERAARGAQQADRERQVAKAGQRSQPERDRARTALQQVEKSLQEQVRQLRANAARDSREALARQREISEAARSLREQMQRASEAGGLAEEQMQASRSPLDAARKAMERAEKKLQQGSPRAAARDQAEAANRLEQAARQLEKSRPLGPEQQRAMADLAKKQRALAEEILELARRVDPKKNREAERRLQEAAQTGEQAADQMDRANADESEQQARETERKLDEARRELEKERDRYLRLRQEELLFRIADEVRLLIEKQEVISQKTTDIAEAQADRERLPRKLRKKLNALGAQEGELAARSRFIAEHLKKEQTMVFSYVLDSVAEDLGELEDLMGGRRPAAGPEVRGLQADIVTRLKSLQGALKDELRRKKQQRDQQQQQRDQQQQQQNTNEGDRKRRLVPDVAELRMLKRLEIDTRERIQDFMRLKQRMPEGFGAWAKRSLKRLALRHARITDLLKEFLRTRGIAEQLDDATEKKDGKEPGK